jgi:hypothetical protein
MKCISCGNESAVGSGFCEFCGSRLEGSANINEVNYSGVNTSSDGKILGILSISAGFLMPLVGIILGVLSIMQREKSGGKGAPLGIIGCITSIVVPIIAILIFVSMN